MDNRTHLCSFFCKKTCRKLVLSRRILRVDWTGVHAKSASKIKSQMNLRTRAQSVAKERRILSGSFHFRQIVPVVWNLFAYARRWLSRSGKASWEKDTCIPDACLPIDPQECKSRKARTFVFVWKDITYKRYNLENTHTQVVNTLIDIVCINLLMNFSYGKNIKKLKLNT